MDEYVTLTIYDFSSDTNTETKVLVKGGLYLRGYPRGTSEKVDQVRQEKENI